MNDKPKPPPSPSAAPTTTIIAPDPAPNDLGHEGFESNIKQNTTDHGQRKDRGD